MEKRKQIYTEVVFLVFLTIYCMPLLCTYIQVRRGFIRQIGSHNVVLPHTELQIPVSHTITTLWCVSNFG